MHSIPQIPELTSTTYGRSPKQPKKKKKKSLYFGAPFILLFYRLIDANDTVPYTEKKMDSLDTFISFLHDCVELELF